MKISLSDLISMRKIQNNYCLLQARPGRLIYIYRKTNKWDVIMKEVYEQYKDKVSPKPAFQYCQCVIYN